uniref:Ion_trans domain-containing protein n=1 Tax=Heterorhabditis bacteriophora TaxID=37862 RepID=A0A1I7X5T2_HETBA
MDNKSSRALILILTTFTYLLLGAAVFDQLESAEDGRLREELAHIGESLQKKYNFTQRDLHLLEAVAVNGIPHKAGFQWQFAGAFYFATVVITTVAIINYLRLWTLSTGNRGRENVLYAVRLSWDTNGPHNVPVHRREGQHCDCLLSAQSKS